MPQAAKEAFNNRTAKRQHDAEQRRAHHPQTTRAIAAQGQHQADQRADIGDEADEASKKPDQETEVQSDDRQADGIDQAEDDADAALPADEAGNGCVRSQSKDLAKKLVRYQVRTGDLFGVNET